MAVRVQLSDGVELFVRVSLEDMRKAYQTALDNNQLLEIESGNGKTRAVNPNQILYFEEVEDASVDDEARDQEMSPGPGPAVRAR
jgi:hypothetical protein